MSQVFFNGLMVGGIFGLLAVSFSLVYGVLGMVNFAFGEIFMFGAFGAAFAASGNYVLAGTTFSESPLPFPVALIIGLLVGTGVGILVERFAYKPLRNAPILSLLIASIAASLLLRSIGQFLFGAGQTPVGNPFQGDSIEILGAKLQPIDIVIFFTAIAAMSILALFIQKTPIGRGIRATAQDRQAAQLMGISVDRVILWTFAVGSFLAALSGILYSIKFRFAVPSMGFLPGLMALVAAVLGGIGNIPGAFLGGLILGMVGEFTAAYLPEGSSYRDVVAFLALGLILWLRPQGLLGTRLDTRV